jgi:Vacuolar segregation subunit 7
MIMAPPGDHDDAPASGKAVAANGIADPTPVPSTEPGNDAHDAAESAPPPPPPPPEPKQITISPPSSQHSPKLSPRTFSPRSSRDTSPTRLANAPATATTNTRHRNRSRKNSEELSPHRTSTTQSTRDIPSAAAVQRALSATGIPRLTPDASSEVARSRAGSSTTAANSSRVKSPPRSAPTSRASSAPRRSDAGPAPSQSLDEVAAKLGDQAEGTNETENNDSGFRSPTRASFGGSTLEAVQESNLPETPAIGSVTSPPAESSRPIAAAAPPKPTISTDTEDATPKASSAILSTESESESGSGKKLSPIDVHDIASNQSLAQAASRNATLQPKKSLSQMSTASSKGKGGGDGSVRNMTVETVDTKTLPHLAVTGATSERGGNRTDGSGTLRVKPSNETIRPKKEKKKATRKAGQGTGARKPFIEKLTGRC